MNKLLTQYVSYTFYIFSLVHWLVVIDLPAAAAIHTFHTYWAWLVLVPPNGRSHLKENAILYTPTE